MAKVPKTMRATDWQAVLDDVDEPSRAEVDASYLGQWMDEHLHRLESWRDDQVRVIVEAVTNAAEFNRPILTIAKAAELADISQKRLINIIGDEKRRLGRLPEWVIDAGGLIQRRVHRDRFIDWLAQKPARRGRPFRKRQD